MKVEIRLFPGDGNLWASRRRGSHGGGHMVHSFLGSVYQLQIDGVLFFFPSVCSDEIDDKAKNDAGDLSPIHESPQPMMRSPTLEAPGVTRSRTLPSGKANKDILGDDKQQRTRVLKKQKRASVNLGKKSEAATP